MATIKARRRPIRDGVERSNERNCRISQVPLAPAEQSLLQALLKRNEAARKACRGRAENSNAAIDRRSIHSGIIAAMNPATVEFSLLKIGARRPVPGPHRYPGVNPKARWKRLA
jgi:hypothetical protein